MADLRENGISRDIADGDSLVVSLPLDGINFDKFKVHVKRVNIKQDTITVGLAFSYEKERLMLIKSMMNKLLLVDTALTSV